jgi:hypothetical protein
MNLLDGVEQCTLEHCQGAASISFTGKAFCLEHFIVQCYESLKELDPRIRRKRDETTELSRLRESVEECSNRALLVSLRCETLTNVDRSRLLDILLWSSDLLFLSSISPRDFALLMAFRAESEASACLDTRRNRRRSTELSGKSLRES